jgi:hypothetical protein
MDKNWLIRTSQNQILGPVAKAKLLEFIQKGALGMTDEVTSGNGYWFSLKEKELVDKYLNGDVPQSYNPISEAKTIVAIRDNPDKTTSINTAPANKTQVLKAAGKEVVITPKEDDLEFPDITQVRTMPSLAELRGEVALEVDATKLPDADDLEFPDLGMISSIKAQPLGEIKPNIEVKTKATPKHAEVTLLEPDEEVILPKEDDLEFPDVDSIKKAIMSESDSTQELKIDVAGNNTSTIMMGHKQVTKEVVEEAAKLSAKGAKPHRDLDADFAVEPLALEGSVKSKARAAELKEKQEAAQKRERHQAAPAEEKKLLHERKTKSAVPVKTSPREQTRDLPPRTQLQVTEPLKKRNDNYIFFILIILVLIILAVFFYFSQILNKPLPV